MKIALVGRYGEGEIVAGPERVARELYLQLKEQNVNVTFIEYFFSYYSDYTLLKKIFGNKITNEGILRLGILPLIFKLLKERFNIIHFVNSQRFTLIIFFLKPFLKAKLIATVHGFYKFELPNVRRERQFLDLFTERFLIGKSNVIVFPSELLLGVFSNEYSFYKQKFRVIPNGIGKEFSNESITTDFNNEISLIFYNAFDQAINKGLKNLVDELSAINYVSIKLFVIGIEEKIHHRNDNLEIIFKGFVNHRSLIKILEEVQFVIKSNAFEPFSIVVAECMTMGVIPIICENTGIKDLVENGVNGFIYESSVSNSLVRLLNDICSNKYDLSVISSNAKKIYEELNWEKVTKQYIFLYQSLI